MAVTDPVVDKRADGVLGSANRLKLAVFGVNDNRGLVMTTAPGPPEATWAQSVRIAQAADRLGFEALVPISRWLGYGGPHNPGARSLEPFTWAAGLSALTERIQLFATLHVPTMHPVMAAKMSATVDHISGGRFGLNIVAGWSPSEIGMFGAPHRDHDQRYEVAAEWATLIKRLWTERDPFDFDGTYFTSPGAASEPKPVQKPYPVMMSAGVSPAGQRFASTHTDMLFVAIADHDATAKTVAAIKAQAREEHGKELQVFGRGHILCRDTEAEARAAYDYYLHEHGDRAAAENFIRMNMANSQSVDWSSVKMQALVEGAMRGIFGHPMTGTPEQVAQMFVDLADTGLDGLALTWFDYEEGLRQYEQQLLPLLVDAGVRAPVAAADAHGAAVGAA
jgi:alkanesulfonate monooxygenase SsuD/methylene tetrahydromethanopterin reductase-like flavin-dependent oxidoreductase (luciferase family)